MPCLLANCLTAGIPFAVNPEYDNMILPEGPEMVVYVYEYTIVYCNKIKQELKRIGAWDPRRTACACVWFSCIVGFSFHGPPSSKSHWPSCSCLGIFS